MKSTLQEIFLSNIKADSKTGITFINGRNSVEHLSYKKLYLQACYKLHALQEKGIKPGDELIFQFESQKNFVITFWACVFGKILPVPLAYVSAADTIKKIGSVWKKLNNPYVITDNPSLQDNFSEFTAQNEFLEDISARCFTFDDLALSKRATPAEADPSEIVFIQFSSGSTGTPKGVTNTQEAILYNINIYLQHLQIIKEDRFLGWVPLTHDMGLVFFHLLPLLANNPQFLMPPALFLTYPDLWMESLSEHNITMTGAPNFGFKLVLSDAERINKSSLNLENLRFMMNGAEPVSLEMCNRFTKAFAATGLPQDCIKPSYGLAEAVLGVSIRYYHDKNTPSEYFLDRGKLNIGDEVVSVASDAENMASFANVGEYESTNVKIVNEHNETLKDGMLGYVCINSPAVTKAYYNDPEITEKTIKDEWLNTGDIGFIKEKDLIITGRAKEMLLINGQNYFPNDLDRLIEELPEIGFQQAVTCSVYNEKTQTDEVFVFTIFKGEPVEFIELARQIKKHIGFKIGVSVSKVIAVDKIHKSTSGKPQRFLMRNNYSKGHYNTFIEKVNRQVSLMKEELQRLETYQIEGKIINIILEVTGLANVNLQTNFFDLGITSIQTAQIQIALEDYFLEKFEDVVLYKYTNTKQLAAFIASDVLQITTKEEVALAGSDIRSAKSRMGRLLKSSLAD